MSMAQAWHKHREQLAMDQRADATWWRASKYELNYPDDPTFMNAATSWQYELDHRDDPISMNAASGATWERFKPFDYYRSTSKMRELKVGPHVTFLRLKDLLYFKSHLFPKALKLFTKEYGLLGLFEEDYSQRPITPGRKIFIAPEAMIDDQGKLQQVDPDTEGRDLLSSLLDARELARTLEILETPEERKLYLNRLSNERSRRNPAADSLTALPSEVKFVRKVYDVVGPPTPLVPWETIQRDFGAFMILDKESFLGVSVLCTREPLSRWDLSLYNFPSGDEGVEFLAKNGNSASNPYLLNTYLQEVSPRAVIGEDGNLERSWYCRSLIQAMHVMLYLDLTGGNTIRKCQSRGCPNYFRVGSQSKSIYCTPRCANRASTRMRRGQEP
jgi:hypothetical protein